jgi:tRNA modification GTPase
VQNKIDKVKEVERREGQIYISAKKAIGIDDLKEFIAGRAKQSTERISDVLINQRHALLLKETVVALGNAIEAARNGLDNTLIAIDIRRATKLLGEITGEIWNEEILNNIFSRFCIGK